LGEYWEEYQVVAPRPRFMAKLLREFELSLRPILERASIKFLRDKFPEYSRRDITDMVVDEEAVAPGLTRFKITISYWRREVEQI